MVKLKCWKKKGNYYLKMKGSKVIEGVIVDKRNITIPGMTRTSYSFNVLKPKGNRTLAESFSKEKMEKKARAYMKNKENRKLIQNKDILAGEIEKLNKVVYELFNIIDIYKDCLKGGLSEWKK